MFFNTSPLARPQDKTTLHALDALRTLTRLTNVKQMPSCVADVHQAEPEKRGSAPRLAVRPASASKYFVEGSKLLTSISS